MKGKKNPVVDTVKKAVKGLTYTSETESKLEPFAWEDGGKLTDAHLLELAGEEKGTAVEQESLDDFFHAVPPEDAEKFQKLAKVIEEQLAGVKVYKVGDEAEKAAYIVRKTTDGKWAGLKTAVVET